MNTNDITRSEKKTGKVRTIAFSESVAQKILELYTLMGSPPKNQSVILNPGTSKPYTNKHINKTLKTFKVKYRLKIKNFSTHSFRKTFGRKLYEEAQNKSEALVMLNEIFKHSTLRITKAYIGITQDEIKSIYQSIEF